MAIQSFQLDPNAVSYTDDEIVGKVNAATADITRADSVAAAARPIGVGEIGGTHIADEVITSMHISESAAIPKTKLAALGIVNEDIASGAAIVGSKLASTAAKDNLDALADTARGYIKTSPTTGEFKIISIQRTAAGLADLDYDDQAV